MNKHILLRVGSIFSMNYLAIVSVSFSSQINDATYISILIVSIIKFVFEMFIFINFITGEINVPSNTKCNNCFCNCNRVRKNKLSRSVYHGAFYI